jgi:hypothetical protein
VTLDIQEQMGSRKDIRVCIKDWLEAAHWKARDHKQIQDLAKNDPIKK